MYTTTKDIAGGTFMTCKDCGYSISMNRLCEKPIQSTTDMLRHMLAHNASRVLAAGGRIIPELEPVRGLFGESVSA
jgi:hypothetical protein